MVINSDEPALTTPVASTAASLNSNDVFMGLTGLHELANILAGLIEVDRPTTLVQIKSNQATRVARLLQDSHLLAEDQLNYLITKKIVQSFADSRVLRIGKQTFMVILEGDYTENRNRIHEFSIAHSPFQVFLNGTDFYPKLIIGATVLNNNIGETMSRLEFAWHQAVNSSGAGYYFAQLDNELAIESIKLLRGLRDVRRALHAKSLGLYAQPIVSLTQASHGPKLELLLREFLRGKVFTPGNILKKAEFNEVMHDIDLYVISLLAQSFNRLFGSVGERVKSVSINISGQSFSSHHFLDMLIHTLNKREVPPNKLIFEITENIAAKDLGAAIATMERMKAAGYKLALDDIGIGSSNFRNLMKFPVDYYKIDRSLSEELTSQEVVRSFVGMVIKEAKRCGKKTIVEGIPDRETLNLVQEMGADYSQSYITGIPAPLIDAPQIGVI